MLEKSRLVLDYIRLRDKPEENRTYQKVIGMAMEEAKKEEARQELLRKG